jgi:uncharacterized protein
MLVLLGFGLVHFYLIWFGDILTLYAVSGLVAFLFRKLPVQRLVALGAAFLLVSMLIFTGYMFSQYQADSAAHAAGATRKAIEEWNDGLAPSTPAPPRSRRIGRCIWVHGLGSSSTISRIGRRSFPAPSLHARHDRPDADWHGRLQIRFLTGEWDDAAYARAARIAIPIGLAACAAIVATTSPPTFTSSAHSRPSSSSRRRSSPSWHWAMRRDHPPVAPAGAGEAHCRCRRCAFTNYLGTSLVATFVFYGWGLGLYGSLSRWQAWLLVPVVWLLMLAWSQPWLEHFHYGPFEWAGAACRAASCSRCERGSPYLRRPSSGLIALQQLHCRLHGTIVVIPLASSKAGSDRPS